MKKLLIATNFSPAGNHAAEYGYVLAKQLKARIILCNAFVFPAEMPEAGTVVWPAVDYEDIFKESHNELKKLKAYLESKYTGGYDPLMSLTTGSSKVTEIINITVAETKVDIVLIGTHSSDGLTTFLLGDHGRQIIDESIKPLILIPREAHVGAIKKIAYATDFEHPQDDLAAIYELIDLARLLNAEILIAHVINEKTHSPTIQKWLDNLLTDLSNKANYPKIYYRFIKNRDPESGLSWLSEHGGIDILAMSHRRHNFLDSILHGSHTQKMAHNINIPLLVFPQPGK